MSENIKKQVDTLVGQAVTGEGRASVLAYSGGHPGVQKEFAREKLELPLTEAGEIRMKGTNEGEEECKS
jgi:hypothetical protein